VEDDGPDEAEGEFGVAIYNVLAPNVDQLDLLVAQEAQRCLDVLYGVESHPPPLPRLNNSIINGTKNTMDIFGTKLGFL
jgi:hypothetical protein